MSRQERIDVDAYGRLRSDPSSSFEALPMQVDHSSSIPS